MRCDQRVTLELSDVLFDFDKDALSAQGKKVLDSTIANLKRNAKGKPFAVTGHTDAKGSDAYNLDLSQRRAATVLKEIEAQIPGAKVSADGAGESQPVAPNLKADGSDNPDGRAKNRRVTISYPQYRRRQQATREGADMGVAAADDSTTATPVSEGD